MNNFLIAIAQGKSGLVGGRESQAGTWFRIVGTECKEIAEAVELMEFIRSEYCVGLECVFRVADIGENLPPVPRYLGKQLPSELSTY